MKKVWSIMRGKLWLAAAIVAAVGCGIGFILSDQAVEPEPQIKVAESPISKPQKKVVESVKMIAEIAKTDPFFRDRKGDVINANGVAKIATQNMTLPQIPNYHLPELPAGSSSMPPSYEKIGKNGRTSIAGILQGESSKNMAILSDGSIVAEGDVYENSQIAVIGGDGIALANGKTIAYESEK